jgi:peptidoglycan LD-endopeptidase LytH
MKLFRRLVLIVILFVVAAVGYVIWWWFGSPTNNELVAWITDTSVRPGLTTDRNAPCPGAPFLLPSPGFIGFLYNDPTAPYSPLNPHTGIDVFGDGEPGTVPVYAVYDGYLSRLPGWLSAVILRIPQDPLDPSRQIWVYYAHMAAKDGSESYIAPEFPPGTSELFVKQGTLLGYQGLYSGTGAPIAMHVHVSIVPSEEDGSFKNEARFSNTIDPSPYFGLSLNAADRPRVPLRC